MLLYFGVLAVLVLYKMDLRFFFSNLFQNIIYFSLNNGTFNAQTSSKTLRFNNAYHFSMTSMLTYEIMFSVHGIFL